jgi:hypothetical protein
MVVSGDSKPEQTPLAGQHEYRACSSQVVPSNAGHLTKMGRNQVFRSFNASSAP